MGGRAKPDPKVSAQQEQSLANVRQPSPGEKMLTDEATGLMNVIHSGDYTTRPKNVFFNFADPAQRGRQRQMMANAGGQGVYALGSPSPNLLASQKQNLDAEYADQVAGQYEQDWSQAGQRAAGTLGDVAGLANSRNLGAFGATTDMWRTDLNAEAQRKKWWQYLIEGGQAAGSMMTGAGAMGARFPH